MGITSLQVCMDSSDWLQGTISEDGGGNGMDSSSPMATPTGGGGGDDMLACSRPLIERRLRPQHEQSLKCPRCESTHTKFCYYNNYSLSQPRYFCKTCRRYWTKGGTLRNIPVGGGCRKNKKVSSKKSNSSDNAPASAHPTAAGIPYSHSPTDLHLAFPDQLHFHAAAAAGIYNNAAAASFMLDNGPTPIDFMDNKYEALLGGHDAFMGGGGGDGYIAAAQNGGGMFSPFGFENQAVLESCQRLMLPYNADVAETKPNAKILSLEWHDHDHGHNHNQHHQQQQQQQQQHQQHACNPDTGKDAFGYNFGSWTGLMNAYGSSAANPLV